MEKGGEEEEEPQRTRVRGTGGSGKCAALGGAGARRWEPVCQYPPPPAPPPPGISRASPLADPCPWACYTLSWGRRSGALGPRAPLVASQTRRQASSPRSGCRSTGARWCPSAYARATRRSR